MFDSYTPAPKKPLWKRSLPFAATGTAVAFVGTLAAFYPTFNRSLERAFNPANQGEMNKYVRRIINAAESKGYVTLEYDGKEIYIDGNQINPDALTLARSDSPVLNNFYRAMGSHADGIKSNLKWIVFAPNVKHESRDTNGLSIGDGIVYIDTIADDGRAKESQTIPGTLAHEDQHESDKSQGLSRLVNETRANKKSLGVLEYQLNQEFSDILRADYDVVKKRIETANFLEKYGSDFQNVNPLGVILAKDLLEAGIQSQTLKKYIHPAESSSGLEKELIIASTFADIVLSNPSKGAIKKLYRYATDPLYNNTLTQVSAASALSYILPEKLQEHSTADIPSGSGRFASIRFGPPSELNGFAQAINGFGFSVSGLPSLDVLLNPTPIPQGEVVRLKIYEGDKIKDGGRKYGIFGSRIILIPGKQGKPANDWIVPKLRPIDTDNNGRDDTLEVYYAHPSMDFENGLMTKVDRFTRMKFVGSGLVELTGLTLKQGAKGFDFELNNKLTCISTERFKY
ncbi:MAG TPA: hypothetical protein VJJ52_04760 [Candidatus Nanoarchaeia archaeon]|nr:hypothetical protein [Candidatus Nanoarchaeia archaeon]